MRAILGRMEKVAVVAAATMNVVDFFSDMFVMIQVSAPCPACSVLLAGSSRAWPLCRFFISPSFTVAHVLEHSCLSLGTGAWVWSL